MIFPVKNGDTTHKKKQSGEDGSYTVVTALKRQMGNTWGSWVVGGAIYHVHSVW